VGRGGGGGGGGGVGGGGGGEARDGKTDTNGAADFLGGGLGENTLRERKKYPKENKEHETE